MTQNLLHATRSTGYFETLEAQETRERLIAVIRELHRQGWAPGTGGNYSTLLSTEPFRLLMSPSGCDKGSMQAEDLLVVDEFGQKLDGAGKSSAETLLHIAIIQNTGANAVLHTHSIWNTLLSDIYGEARELSIHGYEMLKGLSGVTSHEHHEVIPILHNSQGIPALALEVESTLAANQNLHGFLLRNHGLYTWGSDLAEAQRHVEVLEFLFEVIGRKYSLLTRSF